MPHTLTAFFIPLELLVAATRHRVARDLSLVAATVIPVGIKKVFGEHVAEHVPLCSATASEHMCGPKFGPPMRRTADRRH
jgi:hypothetical protein